MLLFSTGTVLAGGGDWKMGPLGPYWDDNDWPEFTPMYWMEEFLNRLDDDDDEIQDWMRQQQYQQQYQRQGSNAYRPNTLRSGFEPFPGKGRAFSKPFSSPLGNEFGEVYNRPMRRDKFEHIWQDPFMRRMLNKAGVPHLTRNDYARMPKDYQRAYSSVMRKVYLANNLRQYRNDNSIRDEGPGRDYRSSRGQPYLPKVRDRRSLYFIK